MNQQFLDHLKNIEKSINHFLPSEVNSQWQKQSFSSSELKPKHISPLIQTTKSLVDLGGKRWRPLFLVLCARSASQSDKNQAQEIAYQLAPLVEFVHTASLIHDDIEDKSEVRRGKPAAYITYGMDTAINAGSWLYFESPICIETLDCSIELRNRLYQNYLLELRKLHLGQAMDIAWHRDKFCMPTVDEYLLMVKHKTGTLASLAAKIGCLCSNASPDVVEQAGLIASEIGAGFQIIDDVINLTTGNPGKKRGDDIVEGKKSLPVLTFFEQNKNNSSIINELANCFETASVEGIESSAIEKAIKLLEKDSSIDIAKQKGIKLIEDGCNSFFELFGKDNKDALLIKELFISMIPKEFLIGENNV